MQSTTKTTLALLAALLFSSSATPTDPPVSQAPPGMVLIPGGRTKIGTSFDDIVKLLEEDPEAQGKAGGYLAETPQHSLEVDDVYLMVTEVTNEQYREYVKSTRTRPPYLWGAKAIEVARDAFLEADAEKRRQAKEAGQPAPERQVFDPAYWWEQNWKGAEWEMPEAITKKPVVYVDYQDARGYAEWAGLRLPTEFEWERAVRGDSKRLYTWGDEWKAGLAATKELKTISDCVDVGSFPDGASEQGVYDLNGNVWEWTSSPYSEYPGWAHKKFNVGKGGLRKEINSLPKWSKDRRVVRGGSQQTGRNTARATTRGGFDRYQQASVLGFRCAASTKAGVDFADDRMRQIPNEVRPRDAKGAVAFLPGEVIAMDRWTSTDGASETPGYAVITGYDYILFTPVEEMQTNGLGDLAKASQKDELTFIGFLSTDFDMVEPALRTGTYLVAVRGACKYPERTLVEGAAEPVEAGAQEESEEGATKVLVDKFLELDPEIDNYIFIDMTGTPVAAMPASQMDYGNITSTTPLGAFVVDKTVMIEVPGEKEGEIEKVPIVQQWLDLKVSIKGRSRKGLKATLSLRFEEGLLDGEWRRR
jgi:formylglycine-generating enzyme required for sulfatase activity